MKRILTVASTSGTNLILAKKIKGLLTYDNEIVCLENFPLPLYNPNIHNSEINSIDSLLSRFKACNSFIFCAPEYNGGSPPILTNAITWLSVSTENFRDIFNEKKALIATHSGGGGSCFLSSFRIQLEHLNVIVYPRTIKVNNKDPFNDKSTIKILEGFTKIL